MFDRALNAPLHINFLRAKPTKWSNTLKQLVGKLPINCLSVFDHFVGLALNWLTKNSNGLEDRVHNACLY